MEKNQDTFNKPEQKNEPEQKEEQKKCLDTPGTIDIPDDPPRPDYDIPVDPPCPDYEKIPDEDEVKEVIKLKLDFAKSGADEVYEDSLTKAEDTKAQAKTKFDAADRSHRSAKKKLTTKIENAQKQLKLDYKKCLRDAIPKKCPSPDDPTCDKKAICVTQLKQSLAKLDIEFQKEIYKINQEKSAADYAWKKTQEDYDAELCVAKAVKNEAYLSAELERRKELSKELDKIQKA